MRTIPLAALAFAVTAGLTACGTTAPVTPEPSVSASSPSPAVEPTPSPTYATPTDESGAALILAGDGLGGYGFGAPQAEVVELLGDQLGNPSRVEEGPACKPNPSPWQETLFYGGLWVDFRAKDDQKTSPRTLVAWGFELRQKFEPPLAMQDRVPLNLGFDELKARYPNGTLEAAGTSGIQVFELTNKIRFIGSDKPTTVQAGEPSCSW